MRTQLRIVSGSLRGRKLTCTVEAGLRPTPDRVREALFNILSSEVTEKPFFDLFAGTGAVGMEALSRGASPVTFVERDGRVAGEILHHLRTFGVADLARVHRADVYRWIERWRVPTSPVIVFLGPPFPDFDHRHQDLAAALLHIQNQSAQGSVLILQSDKAFDPGQLPEADQWEHRVYGRNRLSFWRKVQLPENATSEGNGVQQP